MRKHGPWSRVRQLSGGMPAAALLDPLPPCRAPQVEVIAEALAASGGGIVDLGKNAEQYAAARRMGVVGWQHHATPLGRAWAAIWGMRPADALSRRVLAAGTLLAQDGLPVLALLAASGGVGAGAEVLARAGRTCRELAARNLAHGLRADLRGLATALERASRARGGVVRHLRHRLGWLAVLGLTADRTYGGNLRPGTADPAHVRAAAEAVLRIRPAWALRAPHLHLALWLAALGTSAEDFAASAGEVPARELRELLREAHARAGDLPPREMSLVLCALAARSGRAAEPATFYAQLGRLPARDGDFVSVPCGGTSMITRGAGLAERPAGAAERAAGAAALADCARLFPPDSEHRRTLQAARQFLLAD